MVVVGRGWVRRDLALRFAVALLGLRCGLLLGGAAFAPVASAGRAVRGCSGKSPGRVGNWASMWPQGVAWGRNLM